MSYAHAIPVRHAAGLLLAAVALVGAPAQPAPGDPAAVSAKLSEWKVELSARTIAAGTVTFTIANVGSIPHAFEVEGEGIERETGVIQPGASTTLTLTLKPGTYEVYCPVREDSHKKLGMETDLTVVGAERSGASGYRDSKMGGANRSEMRESPASRETVQAIRVTGGGPVIQILPGPFPTPGGAAPILQQFGAEREGLESQVKNGPNSNPVTPIASTFTFTARDKGAVRDSVDGIADFGSQSGALWKLVLDGVQTRDVPHHPRFGGGNTAVHTPLLPAINSAVARWAAGHLYKNDALVTDNAMAHVMLGLRWSP